MDKSTIFDSVDTRPRVVFAGQRLGELQKTHRKLSVQRGGDRIIGNLQPAMITIAPPLGSWWLCGRLLDSEGLPLSAKPSTGYTLGGEPISVAELDGCLRVDVPASASAGSTFMLAHETEPVAMQLEVRTAVAVELGLAVREQEARCSLYCTDGVDRIAPRRAMLDVTAPHQLLIKKVVVEGALQASNLEVGASGGMIAVGDFTDTAVTREVVLTWQDTLAGGEEKTTTLVATTEPVSFVPLATRLSCDDERWDVCPGFDAGPD